MYGSYLLSGTGTGGNAGLVGRYLMLALPGYGGKAGSSTECGSYLPSVTGGNAGSFVWYGHLMSPWVCGDAGSLAGCDPLNPPPVTGGNPGSLAGYGATHLDQNVSIYHYLWSTPRCKWLVLGVACQQVDSPIDEMLQKVLAALASPRLWNVLGGQPYGYLGWSAHFRRRCPLVGCLQLQSLAEPCEAAVGRVRVRAPLSP